MKRAGDVRPRGPPPCSASSTSPSIAASMAYGRRRRQGRRRRRRRRDEESHRLRPRWRHTRRQRRPSRRPRRLLKDAHHQRRLTPCRGGLRPARRGLLRRTCQAEARPGHRRRRTRDGEAAQRARCAWRLRSWWTALTSRSSSPGRGSRSSTATCTGRQCCR